jgi:hypothetical protein
LVINYETLFNGGYMKKFIVFLFVAVLAAGMVSAQDRNERQRAEPRTPQTVEGTLKLEKGIIAVQTDESVYFVPMLTRYIGFINGLKEDAKVSIEGFLMRNVIHPVKVTVADKSYDFFMPRMGFGMQNNIFGRMQYMRNNRNAPGNWGRPNADRNNRQNPRQLPNRQKQG